MEQNINRDLPVVQSVLQMNPVFFDKLSFERLGVSTGESKVRLKINQKIKKIDDGKYVVTILAEATQENEFIATVQISWYCTVDESDPAKEHLLKENAFAILFPYIRSELTLLTAQPETDPIVWPVMNIQAMMEQAEKKKDVDYGQGIK